MSTDSKPSFFMRIVFPILLGIFTSLGAYFVPKWLSKEERQLSVEIHQNSRLFSLGDIIGDYIVDPKIRDSLNHLTILSLRFVNEGEKGITAKEFVEDIEIGFPPFCKVLGTPKVTDNPSKADVNIKKDSEGKNVYIQFDLLNSRQYFSCDALYISDTPVVPTVTAKIINLRGVLIRDMVQADAKNKKEIRSNISGIIIALLFSAILVGFLYDDTFRYGKVQNKTKYFLIPSIGFNIVLGAVGLARLAMQSYLRTWSLIMIVFLAVEAIYFTIIDLKRARRMFDERAGHS